MTQISSFFLLFFSIFLFDIAMCVPYMNTQNCNPTVCQMPNCRCPTFDIPGNLDLASTPQFVLFTFDDSMYESDFNRMSNYSWVLNNPTIRDSLNCPLKLSWYALEICIFL